MHRLAAWSLALSLAPACFAPGDEESATETDATDGSTGSGTSADTAPVSCGDAVVDPGEECDDGNDVNDDACTNTCTVPACGDGVLQTAAGEQCEDGNDDDTDTCAQCRTARCGDGFVWAGQEECDDGNTDDADGCKNDCTLNACGDGSVGPGEECDDGNAEDNDACKSDCTSATCGDGVMWEGREGCDDGNFVNTDGCKNDCTPATCGDGVVYDGVEECDDGNQINDDLCTNGCTSAACGDGIQQGGEQCDDGNVVDHDGCSATCASEPFCESFSFTCPSGATQWCQQAQCNPTSSTQAAIACEVCMGAACQTGQEPGSCDHMGAQLVGMQCDVNAPEMLPNFAYTTGFCAGEGQVTDCFGGSIGSWCSP